VIAGENIALAKDGGAGHESVSAVTPMRNVLSPSHVSSVNADATTARMDPCFLVPSSTRLGRTIMWDIVPTSRALTDNRHIISDFSVWYAGTSLFALLSVAAIVRSRSMRHSRAGRFSRTSSYSQRGAVLRVVHSAHSPSPAPPGCIAKVGSTVTVPRSGKELSVIVNGRGGTMAGMA
jgi:hypothetical protein